MVDGNALARLTPLDPGRQLTGGGKGMASRGNRLIPVTGLKSAAPGGFTAKPIGQQLWLRWFDTLKQFPPIANSAGASAWGARVLLFLMHR